MIKKILLRSNNAVFNLIGFLAAIILLGGLLLIFYQRNINTNAQNQIETYERVKVTEERIQSYFQGTAAALLSLSQCVDTKTGTVKNFDTISHQISETNKKIDMLSLMPAGTIKYLYPVRGNEKLLGKNVLQTNDYDIKLDAFETQNKKQLKFSGPFKNFAGDSVIAARLPIYINHDFWGFAVVIYKYSNFLKNIGFNKTNQYTFVLSKTSPVTLKEVFFYNEKQSINRHAFRTIKIEPLGWNLYAIHKSHSIYSISLLQLLFCIAASAFSGYFVALLLKRPVILKSHILKQDIQLFNSEMRFKQIFENAPIGMAVLDHKTRFIKEANKKFCELVGKERKYILSGIKLSDFVPLEVYYPALNEFQDMLNGKQKKLFRQYKHNRDDGSIAWTNVTASLLANNSGQSNQSLVMVEDITDAKLAMDELEKSEEKYKSLFNESPIGKWEEDFSEVVTFLEGLGLMGKDEKYVTHYFQKHPDVILEAFSKVKILDVNKAVLELHKVNSKDELFIELEKYIITPKSMEAIAKILISVCKKDIFGEFESQFYTSKGELRDTLLKWHILEGGNTEYSRMIIATDDITDRKHSQTELENSRASLQRSLDLVMEQNKRLKNFSYIVSHNLRSHSGNIQALCELIKHSDDNAEKEELIGHLHDVAHLLHNTMDGLNEVVRIQNNSDISQQELNLNQYIKHTINVLRDRIEHKKVTVINNVDDSIVVFYNQSYLESILLNFISNAIKYSSPHRQPIVKINYTFENNEGVLEISDNGIGIDLEVNGSKLFGLFKTFTHNPDSKGVGLYISKNQIESMGGRVTVESQIDKGTTFKIYFK